MNKLLKLRKSKKGFTLVELLVVIVIIAILMAAIIPSMLGFIDKAKEESMLAECRNTLIAANVVTNENYGKNVYKGVAGGTTAVKMSDDDVKKANTIADTGTIGGAVFSVEVLIDATSKKPTISKIEYNASNGSGYTGTYNTSTKTYDWVKGVKFTPPVVGG